VALRGRTIDDDPREGCDMDELDGTQNAGRKGVAYDWQSLLAEAEAQHLDADLRHLTPASHAA
jgi:hypothetical protein